MKYQVALNLQQVSLMFMEGFLHFVSYYFSNLFYGEKYSLSVLDKLTSYGGSLKLAQS